jgi:hypothetical protein
MKQDDIHTLNQMRKIIAAFRSDGMKIGDLADQLLALRDQLGLTEQNWLHQLTQHIATLDSASTFVPTNESESSQLSAAITTAIDGIHKLIDDALRQSS